MARREKGLGGGSGGGPGGGIREAATNLKSKLQLAYQSYKESYSSSTHEDDDYDVHTRNSLSAEDESRSRNHNRRNHHSSSTLQNKSLGTSSSSGSSPRESSPPRHSEKATKMVEQVMQTLFGACAGTNCPGHYTPNHDDSEEHDEHSHHVRNVVNQIQNKSTHIRRPYTRSAVGTGRGGGSTRPTTTTKTSTSSAILLPNHHPHYSETYTRALHSLSSQQHHSESYYAQQYKNDYAQIAQTDLQRQSDLETQKQWQKKRMENLKRDATLEATTQRFGGGGGGGSNTNRANTPKMTNRMIPHSQKDHNIQVIDGKPYQLHVSEVATQKFEPHILMNDEEKSIESFNYDDGISALSAHTLEEMAKVEARLDRARGIPTEQGFDITCTLRPEGDKLEEGEEVENEEGHGQGPPSPVGTEESSNDSGSSKSSDRTKSSQSTHVTRSNKELDRSGIPKHHTYPVQSARPSSPSALSQTTQSIFSQLDLSASASQEQQYWSQIIEKKEKDHEDMNLKILQDKSSTTPNDQPQKKRRPMKAARAKLFGRRKKNYLEMNCNSPDRSKLGKDECEI